MKAKLTFGRTEIEEMVQDRAQKGGFTVVGEPVWGYPDPGDEHMDVTVDVRPMTPEERALANEQQRPLEERLGDTISDLVVRSMMDWSAQRDMSRDEEGATTMAVFLEAAKEMYSENREELGVDISEWIGLLISKIDKLSEAMVLLDRKLELRPVMSPTGPVPAPPTEVVQGQPQQQSLLTPTSTESNAATPRLARVKAEIEKEAAERDAAGHSRNMMVRDGEVKESAEFPEDMRVK